MFRFSWGDLVLLLNPLLAPLLFLLFGVRRRRQWVRSAAEALGGTLQGRRRITGTTAGVPWELVFTWSLLPPRPCWHLTFPSITSTDLALRAEKTSDQKWKRRRLVAEVSTGDEAFDARHLLLGSDAEAVERLLRHAPLREAIAALPLEEVAPRSPETKGTIAWVQAGQGLEAELELRLVPEAEFPARLATLFQQLHALAKTLQETPGRGTPGPMRRRVLDVNAAFRITGAVTVVSMPVGFTAVGVLSVLSGLVIAPWALGKAWLLGLVAGALLGLPWLWASRGQPAFHRRVWSVPCFAIISSMLLPAVLISLNALPSGARVEERQAKVLSSSPQDMGGVEFWEVGLGGIGSVYLPYDAGKAIPRDTEVQVVLTLGRLGAPRLLSVTPMASPGASPAAGGSVP